MNKKNRALLEKDGNRNESEWLTQVLLDAGRA